MSSPVDDPSLEVEAPAATAARPSLARRILDALRARWARHIAIATLVIGAVAATGHFVGGMVGWWHLYEVFRKAPRAAAQAPGPAGALSIVMLPLVDEGGSDGSLADVVTSDVTTNLGQLTSTMVISRDTAYTYKGKAVDAREVARDLGVRYVVTGSMRREADRIHLKLAMIDGSAGLQHWSQAFALKRGELEAGLQTVSAQIGRSLSVELMKVAAKRAKALRPDEVEADDIAIRGWGVYFQGVTKENVAEALRLFEQAVERDPKSVRGWGGVGIMNSMRAFTFAMAVERPVAIKRMEEALARLQALDQDDPMTHLVRISLANARDDFGGALQAAESMVQRYPNHPRAYSTKGQALTYLGRTEECLEPGRQALRISPRDVAAGYAHLQIAICHFMRGEYAESAESARAASLATPALVGNHPLRAAALAQLGNQDEARVEIEEYRRRRAGATSETAGRVFRGNHEKVVASRQVLVAAVQALGLP